MTVKNSGLLINWFGALLLILILVAGIVWWSLAPSTMSEGHKAADARYRACLDISHERAGSGWSFDPKSCDGALGQYGKVQ